MATEDAFIRNIIEEEQRQKERDKKRKAHEGAFEFPSVICRFRYLPCLRCGLGPA